MMPPGQSDRHLSRTQLEVLQRIANNEEYVGMDGNEERTCRSLVRRGLVMRTAVGTLPLFAITPTGVVRLGRRR